MSRQRAISAAARFADVILITGCLAGILVCLYFVYNYSWTGARQFTSPWGPYLYYGAPAGLSILLLAALKLRPSRKVNAVLLLCSAGVAIYGMETLATLWFALPSVIESGDRSMRSKLAREQGIEFDARSRAKVIDDFRGRGTDAVPAIYPQDLLKKQQNGTVESAIRINGTEVLSLGGVASKLTVVCNEGGRFLTYQSDEHGFNNPQNLWKTSPMDVMAVGDSFTHGFCVGPDDNFVAQIRKRYPATLNLGIGGDGPLTMLAALKEYGEIVRPKVVLWFYFESNDLADLSTERRSSVLDHYLTNGATQNLFGRQADIDVALTNYIETVRGEGEMSRTLHELSAQVKGLSQPTAIKDIVKLSALRNRLGLVQGKEEGPAPEIDSSARIESRARAMKDIMTLLNQVLLEAKKSVDEWGGELYFVYLPGWSRYSSTGDGPNPDRDSVLEVVKSAGLPLIDIHKVFAARPDPLALFPFRLGPHYNEEGHRLVAEEVLRSITVGQVNQ